MATHSFVLAWRIPGTAEPGGLPSMELHRVGHDWSELAAAAAAVTKTRPFSKEDLQMANGQMKKLVITWKIFTSQNHSEIPFRTYINSYHQKKTRDNKCYWRHREKRILLYYINVQSLWRTVWRILKKTKTRNTRWLSNPTPGHTPGENDNSKRYMHPVFTAVLFTIARRWKQPKLSSTEEWIKKWYINTMEYYSAIKRNKTVPLVETWMDLKTVVESKVSQEN